MTKKGVLTFGHGINDTDYVTCTRRYVVDGDGERKLIVIKCPFYVKWHNMLRRCFVDKRKTPNYLCDDWLYLSKFKAWMETQDWEGKHLDKDILGKGLNLYSPDTAAFVTKQTNTFVNESKYNKTEYLPGAQWIEHRGKFRSAISKLGKITFLGHYDTEIEAHLAWKKEKHKIALYLADQESDERVKEVLRTKWLDEYFEENK